MKFIKLTKADGGYPFYIREDVISALEVYKCELDGECRPLKEPHLATSIHIEGRWGGDEMAVMETPQEILESMGYAREDAE